MRKTIEDMFVTLLALHIKRVKNATYYHSPKCTVRITEAGKWEKRKSRLNFRMAVGCPNHAERKFIKKLNKAGEKFPVKKVQLKFRKAAK